MDTKSYSKLSGLIKQAEQNDGLAAERANALSWYAGQVLEEAHIDLKVERNDQPPFWSSEEPELRIGEIYIREEWDDISGFVWYLYYLVHDVGSWEEPPSTDEVEVATYKHKTFNQAIENAVSSNYRMRLDNIFNYLGEMAMEEEFAKTVYGE